MRRVLVFQHVAVEPLGTLLPLLRSYGLRIRYVNFERDPGARPSVEGYDGLIVLGGRFAFGAGDILLVGRESAGLPDSVHNAADARLVIPMTAGLRSLNVATASGIAMHHYFAGRPTAARSLESAAS